MKGTCGVLSAAFCAALASTALAGGWAVSTVTRLPDVLVAGRAARIEFIVRQHGHVPMHGANASLRAEANGVRAAATVRAEAKPGIYVAEIMLPSPGRWTMTLTSGLFDRTTWTMPVVAEGKSPPAETAAQQGLRLFAAKGCATCHVHSAAAASASVNLGPDLSGRPYQPEVLAAFVLRPKPCVSGQPCMPALEVDAREIAALAAFLTTGGTYVAAR